MKNDFFCVLPWTEIFVEKTQAKPCCVYKPKSQITIKGYSSNKEIEELKNEFLNDKIPSQCSVCYENELKTGYSNRIASSFGKEKIRKKIINGTWEVNYYENIHILTSNLCNLKCLPCEYGSYSREVELKTINFINRQPQKYTIDNDYENLLNFKFDEVTILGGEPFYDKKSMEVVDFLIDNNKSKNTTLYINSNFTNLDDNVLDRLSNNFFKVILKASVDGIEKRNDYLRYPSNWIIIQDNIRKIKKYPNFELYITTALSNLSLIGFSEIVEWLLEENINMLFISMVNDPSVLSPNVLPLKIKKALIPKLKKLLEIDFCKNSNFLDRSITIKDCIRTCIQICEDETDYSDQWEKTKKWINVHDKHRGNSVLKIFPELKDFW